MNQLFSKKDPRRRWNGYWIFFYPDEFVPPNSKSLNYLHIHFSDEGGEIRIYLSPEKYLDIEEKWGIVPRHERTKIIKFVERNKQDIMVRVDILFKGIRTKIKIIW